MRRVVMVSFVCWATIWMAACKPGDGGSDGPKLNKKNCNSDSDCGSGQLCNPGSLFCVDDVTVGTNAFAGGFELRVASDEAAGLDQNLFARVNLEGKAYTLHDFMLMSPGGSTLSFGATTFGEMGAYDDLLWFTLPLDKVMVGSPMLLSDDLTPSLYQNTGGAMLIKAYTDAETGAQLYHQVIGQVDSGVFTLTEMSESGTTVAGNFKGSLRPPVYISAASWMDADCSTSEVVDPFVWACSPMFAGYDLIAGVDAILDCAGCYHGFVSATYDIMGESGLYQVNEYPFDVWAETAGDKITTWGFVMTADGTGYRGLEVTIPKASFTKGKTLSIGSQATVALWIGALDEEGAYLVPAEKVGTFSTGQVKVAYAVGGANGRISLYVKAGLAGGE